MAACSHQCSMYGHGNQRQLLFLLIFSISIFSQSGFSAQGRVMPKQLVEDGYIPQQVRRMLIGSRPPRCENKCRNCGHCEAIQVPIVPNLKNQPTIRSSHDLPKHIAYNREDYLSNYKPMCWKCKCGDLIFNP
ncbi:unnamed protein product [Cuscuta epithymum]|uniref:Epidermal patterning factor-like protein n=1 Tax=Cuscuta epithymum TaxID=186058 RepID=A0AAV0EDY6_9ASTE|nr:unnamed protein product [Cuscuta epithymum]